MDVKGFILEESQRCLHCELCMQACDIAPALRGALPLDAAVSVARSESDARVQWFVPRCSLCGRCVQACPQGIDIPKLMVAARGVLLEGGFIDSEKYRAMFIDCDWNAISLYRRTFDMDFSAFHRNRCDVAFLPGCSLLNDGPELVYKTLAWLEDALQCDVGLVDGCCGMPLQEMGMLRRYRAYEDKLWRELREMGVRKLIVGCPNCLGRLAHRGSQEGTTVQLVYELMATMGLHAPTRGEASASVHDSCPARGTQMGEWVRDILADWPLREMENHGNCATCCGSGGAVGMYDYVLRDARSRRRRDEFAATGADFLVTYCMSSCSTLFDEQQCPQVCHILELVFQLPIDHAANARRVAQMWTGDKGALNDKLLSSARIVASC